jgi:hypothetical protein
MNNYNQLKKRESVTSEEWKMLPMQKTNNHCKPATKNRYKRKDNIDLY